MKKSTSHTPKTNFHEKINPKQIDKIFIMPPAIKKSIKHASKKIKIAIKICITSSPSLYFFDTDYLPGMDIEKIPFLFYHQFLNDT